MSDGEYIEVGRSGKDAKSKPKSGKKGYLLVSVSSVADTVLRQLADGSIVSSCTISRCLGHGDSICVTDTGATHTMDPNYDAFISYHRPPFDTSGVCSS